jgi:hypothetical protein
MEFKYIPMLCAGTRKVYCLFYFIFFWLFFLGNIFGQHMFWVGRKEITKRMNQEEFLLFMRICIFLLLLCSRMSASFRVFLNHASSSFSSAVSRPAASATFRSARGGRLGSAVITARYASTEVTAALVKELRERSGAPMMDCKKALSAESVNGDIAKAMDYLRAKGLAKAASNVRRP